jgi:hypothetical protein
LIPGNCFLAGPESHAAIIRRPAFFCCLFKLIFTGFLAVRHLVVLIATIFEDHTSRLVLKRRLSAVERALFISNLNYTVIYLWYSLDTNVVGALAVLASPLAEAVKVDIAQIIGYYVNTG